MTGNIPTSSKTLTRADVEQQLISKAVEDAAFRQALLENPQAVWQQEFGKTSLKDLQLSVWEETDHSLYLVLPSEDSAFRKELTEHPQAVWQREFGKARLKGYVIRVVEEPIGHFYLVLPTIERSPLWVDDLLPSSPDPTSNSRSQPWENTSKSVQQRYRSLTHRRYPKTKLGRIAFRLQTWVVMTVLTNPIVTSLLRPFYVVRGWIDVWRRL